jgi:hypothetical protein
LHILPDGLEWDQNRVCDLTLFLPHFVFISDSFSLPNEEDGCPVNMKAYYINFHDNIFNDP